MRSIEEIEADIEFVRMDLKELREMRASTYAALQDLIELFEELETAHEETKPL